MSGSSHDLFTLERLRRIVSAIDEAGEALTATKIKRVLGLNDADFAISADHGCSIKVLKWHSRNFYSVVKPFTVPEEAYYDWVQGGHCQTNVAHRAHRR